MIHTAERFSVLCVDDMPANLAVLDGILRDEYIVLTATNGHDALEIATGDSPPDLILLDVVMPGMDGYQVCRTLKKIPATAAIPVIFVTSLDDEGNEEKGFSLGAVDYVQKPFSQLVIRARVRAHLVIYRTQRILEKTVRERTRALERAKEKAEEANRAKTVFLANVSHELRTPLNGVLGMAQLLSSTSMSGEQRYLLASLKQSAGRLGSLVSDILEHSSLEAGMLRPSQDNFVLKEALAPLIRHFGAVADKKNILFTHTVQDGVPRTLAGDRGALIQILHNLLDNACNYTSVGTVGLHVALWTCENICTADNRKAVWLRFDVRDTGSGIPEAKGGDIFAPFSIAEHFLTKRLGGAGLGLAVARQLAERDGGEISFVSKEGVGSTFSVVLPFLLPC
jgi:signal transduction histidine kinase